MNHIYFNMSMEILLIVSVSFVIALAWLVYLTNRNRSFFKTIPSPSTLPFFGHVLTVRNTTEILDVLLDFVKNYGGVVRLDLGPIRKALLISDYKFLEHILSSTKILNKAEEYKFLHPWLGTGLLTSDGPKWKKHRRILTPAFHFQILEQFIGVFETAGNTFIRKLEKEDGKKNVDIYPYVTLCTLDIICESAMGTSVNAQNNGDSIYVKSVKEMCRIISERTFSVLQMFEATFSLTQNFYVQKKSLEVLHKQTNDVISTRREELLTKEQAQGINEFNDNETKRKKAFLDLLLQTSIDGKRLTQEDIRQEVDTFMFEGHDTTASAISFALYALANNPEVQKKAYEEQLSLFGGDKNPEVTYADLQSMKYLELVIKETLRLYPSVPYYARRIDEPVEYNGKIIPKGLTLVIFAFGIHRNPIFFEEPEKFNPNRFEGIDGKSPYAYIPFSAGPRNCIGQKFAMLEMKSTISKVIRNFELQPARPIHKLQLTAETVLKSANGIKIGISRRI